MRYKINIHYSHFLNLYSLYKEFTKWHTFYIIFIFYIITKKKKPNHSFRSITRKNFIAQIFFMIFLAFWEDW